MEGKCRGSWRERKKKGGKCSGENRREKEGWREGVGVRSCGLILDFVPLWFVVCGG